MASLMDKDQTSARERQYPNTAGNAVKQIIAPVAQAHAELSTKYIELVQEIMKLPDVHFSIKMAILPVEAGGAGIDPLVFGGSLPAIMMTKLEQLGVIHGEISGGMTVSESNKGTEAAATTVQSGTSAGIGTPFWHVTEQLNVQHGTHSSAARATDYRARLDFKFEIGPIGEAEGVGLIKEMAADQSKAISHINQTLADAQKEIMLAKLKDAKPATEKDEDAWLGKTDPKDLLGTGEQESGDSSESGDDFGSEDIGEDTGEASEESGGESEGSSESGDIN